MLRPGGPRYRRTRWLRILALCFMTFQVRGFVLGALSRVATRSVGLQAADSDKNFNKQKFLRRPEFDPLSLQDFRREALLQYSNTNQSEPLRILIFLFLTICGLFSPTFFPSNAGPPFFVAAATVTLASGFPVPPRTRQANRAVGTAGARVFHWGPLRGAVRACFR